MKKKTKKVKRWRAMAGDKYCSLNTNLHELGVCIPDATQETAHIFTNQLNLNNAITRTHAMQNEISKSMIADYKGFVPLKFQGSVMPEEFQVEVEV